jgi:hypothetical protein
MIYFSFQLYCARYGFVHCIRKAGYRHCERSEAIHAPCIHRIALLHTSQFSAKTGMAAMTMKSNAQNYHARSIISTTYKSNGYEKNND